MILSPRIFVFALYSTVAGQAPVVDLGYASYRGQSFSGISQWLGMRFAAAPVGDLRFAAPQDPPKTKEIQDAFTVRTTVPREITIVGADILL
jgi:carboxylesterase type B